MIMRRSFRRKDLKNLGFAGLCGILLYFQGEVNGVASIVIASVVYIILTSITTLSRHQALVSYKMEFVLSPEWGKLIKHDTVKEYYDKGQHALSERKEIRFRIVNGLIWSDFHKTFMDERFFSERILGYDISEDEKEPYLDIELKKGLLRLWLSLPKKWSDNQTLICEFPLFIYERTPVSILNFDFDDNWREYEELQAMSGSKKYYQKKQNILKKYGFEPYSNGERNDTYEDRDGEVQLLDHDRGYSWYKHPYLTVMITEIDCNDELQQFPL
jgi:hypothetical protein